MQTLEDIPIQSGEPAPFRNHQVLDILKMEVIAVIGADHVNNSNFRPAFTDFIENDGEDQSSRDHPGFDLTTDLTRFGQFAGFSFMGHRLTFLSKISSLPYALGHGFVISGQVVGAAYGHNSNVGRQFVNT
jgi:hypothetical protein